MVSFVFNVHHRKPCSVSAFEYFDHTRPGVKRLGYTVCGDLICGENCPPVVDYNRTYGQQPWEMASMLLIDNALFLCKTSIDDRWESRGNLIRIPISFPAPWRC